MWGWVYSEYGRSVRSVSEKLWVDRLGQEM